MRVTKRKLQKLTSMKIREIFKGHNKKSFVVLLTKRTSKKMIIAENIYSVLFKNGKCITPKYARKLILNSFIKKVENLLSERNK